MDQNSEILHEQLNELPIIPSNLPKIEGAHELSFRRTLAQHEWNSGDYAKIADLERPFSSDIKSETFDADAARLIFLSGAFSPYTLDEHEFTFANMKSAWITDQGLSSDTMRDEYFLMTMESLIKSIKPMRDNMVAYLSEHTEDLKNGSPETLKIAAVLALTDKTTRTFKRNADKFTPETTGYAGRFRRYLESYPIEDTTKIDDIQVDIPDSLRFKMMTILSSNNPPIPPEDAHTVSDILNSFVRINGEDSRYEKLRNDNFDKAMQFAGYIKHLPIDREIISKLYGILSRGITNTPFELRSSKIERLRGRPECPDFTDVPQRFESVLAKINALTPIDEAQAELEAAEIMADYQDTHPTIDFNGRLGHILANIALWKMGQPGFDVPKENYGAYYDAVTEGVNDKDYSKLTSMIHEFKNNSAKTTTVVDEVGDNQSLSDPLYDQIINATKLSDLPSPFSIYREGGQIVDSDEFQVDLMDPTVMPKNLEVIIQKFDLLEQRMIQLGGNPPKQNEQKEYLLAKIKEKRAITKALSPGSFFAQGAYVQDLDSMIALRGLASSASRVTHDINSTDSVPRWGTVHNPEANAIFFYQLAENGAQHAGRYYSKERGHTDMTVIYPSESITTHAKAVEIRGIDARNEVVGEVAVTSSESSITAGQLTDKADDTSILPLEEAYVQVSPQKKDEIVRKFLEKGYSKEWCDIHVFTSDVPGLKWMADHHHAIDQKVRIRKYSGNFYGVSADEPKLRS